MVNIVEFPGLGLELTVNRVAFTLFGVDIYWYGVCIGVGMALALVFAFTQAKRFGVDVDRMIDVVMIGLVSAIIGGRAYFLIFDDQKRNTLFEIIDLRSGGIAIYGGIIMAFVGAALACKWRKVPTMPLFDLAGMGFLIGQGLGRWGNFFNQEAFGSNTTLPWGMRSQETIYYLTAVQQKLAEQGVMVDPQMPVHPTFLYESLWCALGFLLLFLYRKKRKFNGEIFLFYVIWYGAGRFFIEGLRTDALLTNFFNLRVSQLVAAVSVVAALAIWVFVRIKRKGMPLVVPKIPPHTARVKLPAENGKGAQTVVISWPADEKAPDKEKRLQMARELLKAEMQEKQEEIPAKKDNKAEQETAENKNKEK